ncbi:hypothetical protein SAMN02745166_02686 [Prosthecobacter debontii]|uniref:Polysaccharide lyase n=1 Tax=Prosthecobacter debontii TaxID=48467 RepID=A0A1T4Y9E0_9BACT|nr:hypothetical protein [Prosthecobacter debontii]SKA98128.1 hypothetical protein SAMN02745166_02686 [Prosthecobacter debontii]
MMKKTALFASSLILFSQALSAELKTFTFTADEWPEGDPPKEVFVVDGTIKVGAKDGNKAVMISPDNLVDASAQFAVSAAGDSVIKARVFASKKGRSNPRFGIAVHGMSGYRLLANAPKKQLELVKNEEVLASVPLTWTSDAWVWMKLEARKQGDEWIITGKTWAADASEPAEAQLTHKDKGLKGQGKASVWATPYSGTPIYFDDIEVGVEVPAETK